MWRAPYGDGVPPIMSPTDLEPGDLLVGYSHLYAGEYGGETGYSHAAIHIGAGEVLESDGQGVQINDIDHVHLAYDHLAVLRTEDMWSPARISRLRAFAQTHVGKRFNAKGVSELEAVRVQSIQALHRDLEKYFLTRHRMVNPSRELYFCSELVSAAFIDAGVISESAALCFRPETLTPGDLMKDKAFGFFVGYLPKTSSYQIPDDDWFSTNL